MRLRGWKHGNRRFVFWFLGCGHDGFSTVFYRRKGFSDRSTCDCYDFYWLVHFFTVCCEICVLALNSNGILIFLLQVSWLLTLSNLWRKRANTFYIFDFIRLEIGFYLHFSIPRPGKPMNIIIRHGRHQSFLCLPNRFPSTRQQPPLRPVGE